MTTSAKLASVVLFSSLAFASGSAPVWAEDAGYRVAPQQGITLTVGSKRAISYYTTNADKACNLTLLLADAYSDAGKDRRLRAGPGQSDSARGHVGSRRLA